MGRVYHIPDTANSISRFEGGGYPMAFLVLWRVCNNLQGSQACRSGPDNTDRFSIRVGIVRQRHWQEELEEYIDTKDVMYLTDPYCLYPRGGSPDGADQGCSTVTGDWKMGGIIRPRCRL